MNIIRKVHRTQGPGHVLAFFTGQDEIERAGRLLSEAVAKEAVDRRAMGLDEEEPDNGVSELLVVPLFGALSAEAQAEAFKPAKAGVRKVTAWRARWVGHGVKSDAVSGYNAIRGYGRERELLLYSLHKGSHFLDYL